MSVLEMSVFEQVFYLQYFTTMLTVVSDQLMSFRERFVKPTDLFCEKFIGLDE